VRVDGPRGNVLVAVLLFRNRLGPAVWLSAELDAAAEAAAAWRVPLRRWSPGEDRVAVRRPPAERSRTQDPKPTHRFSHHGRGA